MICWKKACVKFSDQLQQASPLFQPIRSISYYPWLAFGGFPALSGAGFLLFGYFPIRIPIGYLCSLWLGGCNCFGCDQVIKKSGPGRNTLSSLFSIQLACNVGVLWRAIECILAKRAPSWIQTRKRLGERRDGVLREWVLAKRRVTWRRINPIVSLYRYNSWTHGKRLRCRLHYSWTSVQAKIRTGPQRYLRTKDSDIFLK